MQNDNRQTIDLTTDHFREAEQDRAAALRNFADGAGDFARLLMDSAKVHALLAQVTATNRVADDEDVIAGAVDNEAHRLRVAGVKA